MSVEDRLRQAWGDGGEPPTDDGWRRIRAGVTAAETARRRRRLLGGGAVALAAAVAVIAGIVVADDPLPVETGPVATDPTTSTTTDEPASSTSTTTTAVPEEPDPYVWESDAATPGEAAGAFLRDLVGMARFTIVDQREEGGRFEVDVVPREDLTAFVTTVVVGEEDGWFGIVGSSSPNIRLESPQPGFQIASPLRPSGEARAFEGNVEVLVVQDDGRHLGEGFVTGSGGPELGSFHGEVRFDAPSEDMGALVLRTSSAEDGAVLEATVIRVWFSRCGPFDQPPGRTVLVFFECGEGVVAVPRAIGEGTAVLRTAMEALLEGPTAEERERGVGSVFGPETAGLLRGVTISDGTAVVDLDARFPRSANNASTAAGSMGLLDQLDATVFQFETVQRVEYRVDGSCDDFFGWLGGECQVRERP